MGNLSPGKMESGHFFRDQESSTWGIGEYQGSRREKEPSRASPSHCHWLSLDRQVESISSLDPIHTWAEGHQAAFRMDAEPILLTMYTLCSRRTQI